ncbi:MAG: UDP-N-acetylglucosamine 2-epimerase [Proteobacteria bacterium]|nr:UDP-N-acetylglucosamine 2-epimerase [Pseudomonadota bacterium]
MKRSLVVYGTRPEFLKVQTLLALDCSIDSLFIQQHTDIIDFGLPTHKISILNTCSNRLNSIFCEIFNKAESIIDSYDNIIVQGDTATVAAVSFVAYHLNKKLFYIESGLRSFDLNHPYPEEGYRQMIARIADVNFAPTSLSSNNLKEERVSGKIHTVGNSALDNLLEFKTGEYGDQILITLHRRENHHWMDEWFREINKLAIENPNLEFILPIHPNPNVQKHRGLLTHVNVVPPLTHEQLINTLRNSKFIISDSGGLQEEGSFFNKKVIVCRETTERPEGIHTGHLYLCPSPSDLKVLFDKLKEDYYIDTKCPYGDGKTSKKILNILNEN